MTAAALTAPEGEYLLELRFPARSDRMVMVRDLVRSAARFCGFDEAGTHDIVLAVGEACQNVILHAYEGRGDGPILLDILQNADSIILRVTDFGPAVAPTVVQPRELRELRPGGLGTYFIQNLMDTTDFGRSPSGVGNVLQMSKRKDPSK
jgi:anti-sigma regulatory factor (Ser/Thr protein kinase)